MKKITIKEYAEIHGITAGTARQRALRGAYKTAEKIGRDWFISADEVHVDNRVRSGRYIKNNNNKGEKKWKI